MLESKIKKLICFAMPCDCDKTDDDYCSLIDLLGDQIIQLVIEDRK